MKIENGILKKIEEEDIVNGVVEIPDNVDNIEYLVFNDLRNLTSINVDSKNQNYMSINGILFNKSGNQLIRFPEGSNYTEYTIPDSVTKINMGAFHHCYNLQRIEIPDSVTDMDNGCFSLCVHLKEVILPTNITTINAATFFLCESLKEIVIPDSVTSIGVNAFYRM